MSDGRWQPEAATSTCHVFTPSTASTATNHLSPFTIRDLAKHNLTRGKQLLFIIWQRPNLFGELTFFANSQRRLVQRRKIFSLISRRSKRSHVLQPFLFAAVSRGKSFVGVGLIWGVRLCLCLMLSSAISYFLRLRRT